MAGVKMAVKHPPAEAAARRRCHPSAPDRRGGPELRCPAGSQADSVGGKRDVDVVAEPMMRELYGARRLIGWIEAVE